MSDSKGLQPEEIGRKYKKVDSTRTINHTRNRRQTNTDRMKLKRMGFLTGLGRMHKIPNYSQIAQMTENERLETAAAGCNHGLRVD